MLKKPKVVQLSITNKCQCNCEHCGVSFFKNKFEKEISLETVNEIFKDLKLNGCEIIDLFGGEPTLRKDIFDIISLGKHYGFKMLLETNGLLLNSSFIHKLKKAGLDLIYLSLDDYVPNNHDTRRNYHGLFQKAVRALSICSKLNIEVHTCILIKDKDYYTNGSLNNYIAFCLRQGANKIRILFPSHVGNWSLHQQKLDETDELSLFKYVDKKYYPFTYIEVDNNNAFLKHTSCPAKTVFCHIRGNGLVTPCPYLPLVFGDITKESILTIFSRIQNHPIMKKNGDSCPTRNKLFIRNHLNSINKEHPYQEIHSINKVNLFAPCNNKCTGCNLGKMHKTTEQILREIGKIDPGYDSIDLYGGEIFLHPSFFKIMRKIPNYFKLNLYSNGRIFYNRSLLYKLIQGKVNSFKIPFFSLNKEKFYKHTGIKNSYNQTCEGIKNLCNQGYPVSVFIPKSELTDNLDNLISFGVVSINSYQFSNSNTLDDSILCFGHKLSENKLIWLRR